MCVWLWLWGCGCVDVGDVGVGLWLCGCGGCGCGEGGDLSSRGLNSRETLVMNEDIVVALRLTGPLDMHARTCTHAHT